jgi:hypothetical protein
MQIQIKIEHFQDAHNTCKIQSKQDTAEQISNSTSSVPRSTPSAEQVASEINRDLQQLYQNLHVVFEPQQGSPVDAWEYESEDEWDNNNNNNNNHNNHSKDSPPQGDSTHPPSQWVCREHPGMGWELNDPFTTSYYRVLIPDPTTNRLIVAPYILYAIQHSKAEVQATYSKGYPIHNRVLQPIPMDYICPPLHQQNGKSSY